MKQATILLRGIRAGVLTEDENGYTFQYDAGFLASDEAEAISLTLPLTEKPYKDKILFPFQIIAKFRKSGIAIANKQYFFFYRSDFIQNFLTPCNTVCV